MEIRNSKINLVRPICRNLVGQHHGFGHRAGVGVVIMICGVVIAKSVGHHEQEIIALFGDTVGYALHGIGLIPFVEHLLEDAA